MRRSHLLHPLVLALLFATGATPARAQRERPAPGACQRARAELRAELSRQAAIAPRVVWSTELAGRTAAGATITASQRALYARARAMLEGAVPFLDSIHPLHADVDEPAIEQTRPQLRARLTELSGELGREDGPRSEIMEPQLRDAGALVARLGLVLCRAGALDEQEEASTLARYVRLEHAMTMVRRDWIAAGPPRREMLVATGPSMPPGGDSVLIPALPASGVSDTLDAITQALDSLSAALDASMSAESRDSLAAVAPNSVRVPLADVLGRVERFATEDVPRVLEAGGVNAMPALTATADTLRRLVRDVRLPAPAPTSGAGATEDADVRAALDRLAQRLDALYRLLSPAPTISP